jgi:hypothetical protein
MTPAQFLDIVIPKWQQGLPPKYTPTLIARFVANRRKDLEGLVGEAFALRRAQQGKAPRDPAEWAAYASLVGPARERDAEPDAKIIRRIQTRMDKLAAKLGDDADARATAWSMGVEYVQQRAQAILMGARGWDAVSLLLRRPVTLILSRQGKIVCLYGADAETHMVPNIAAEKLRADLGETRKQLGEVAAFSQQPQLERWALGVWAMARSRVAVASPPVAPIESPPDLREKPWRTEANLAAMQLVLTKEPGEFAAEELKKLAQYSGWGGLSIEAVAGRVPAEIVPETFGLIHEYYTPSIIADALAETLCPLLAELAGNDAVVRALEPSAGIGRLIRAFTPRRCLALEAGGQIRKIEWTAVEFSKVSSRLLRALRPDVDLYHMPFERWIREESARFNGTISLVVSNPPYGERGAMAREDPDDLYKEKRAYAYFMRRALDLLVPGGIGVFLVPAGFLSGNLNRGLREKLLRRHHLLGAFRLPSHDRKGRENVPGASVVMDMVFWRSRGGELAEIDDGDRYIAEGEYFTVHKGNLLGVEDGSFSGDDEVGKARSWRYKVTGDLPTTLPPLTPRPICTACVLNNIAPREAANFQTVTRTDDGIPDDVDDELRHALELGARVGRYLAALGADEAERAALLWPELNAALRDFAASFGNPARSAELRSSPTSAASRRLSRSSTPSTRTAPSRPRCASRRASPRSSRGSPTTSSPRPRPCSASSAPCRSRSCSTSTANRAAPAPGRTRSRPCSRPSGTSTAPPGISSTRRTPTSPATSCGTATTGPRSGPPAATSKRASRCAA